MAMQAKSIGCYNASYSKQWVGGRPLIVKGCSRAKIGIGVFLLCNSKTGWDMTWGFVLYYAKKKWMARNYELAISRDGVN
jgi:hypothetical protein